MSKMYGFENEHDRYLDSKPCEDCPHIEWHDNGKYGSNPVCAIGIRGDMPRNCAKTHRASCVSGRECNL